MNWLGSRSWLKGFWGLCLISKIQAQEVNFSEEVEPLFRENCIRCHGEDKTKSGLRLDQRVAMLRGGDSGLATIVPGHSEKSYLIEVVSDHDSDMLMPPKGDPLTSKQVALLAKWVDEGAHWPGQMDAVLESATTDHWSFQEVRRPQVPGNEVNPIDSFLLRKLQESDIDPNSEADARSLIRRASVILTGLPPTPSEVEVFTKEYEKNPDAAYEGLVDRLLASKHYGERWAQHWLDVIRWAETNGSESNLYRKGAWRYRDYVVNAFNNDLPYNRFITEQLAGDRLGAGEATGFLVAGPHVPAATVGRVPAAIRQARADRMDEVIQTVSASMLGVTVSCARCHNHKFDPVTIQDYYSMAAVFQGVEFGGRRPELGKDHPAKKRATKIYPKLNEERKILREAFGFWEENWGGYVDMAFPKTKTKTLRVEFMAAKVFIDELEVFGPSDYRVNLAHRSKGTILAEDPGMIDEGSPVSKANDGEYGTMVWKGFAPKGSKKKPWVEIRFREEQEVNRFRFSSNREYYFETDYLAKMPNGRFPGYRILALESNGSWKEVGNSNKARVAAQKNPAIKASKARLQQAIRALSDEGPAHSFIGRFIEPVVTRVLSRGSPENPRDEVMPAGFSILNADLGLDSNTPDSDRRLSYAKWMTEPNHPLTSRVMVNRLWHHIFGTGIVPTTSDFGVAGARPSHPELLDWLASEFMEKGWSTKNMVRLMVTSKAFRRSSLPSSLAIQKDAGSFLLWRYPPRRIEAEVIRDGILQASGKLDPRLGGKSFRIHNVKKTYSQWEVVNNHGPETWRRMLYQERMRRVDDQIFTAFDFPDCGQVRAKRPVSTTPLQALNLLNSPFVIEQSGLIAERVEREAGGTKETQVRQAFQLLLSRDPKPEELAAGLEVELDILCRSLINTNEFAFLP